jgi:nucleotide-binding universal stress UspA family protein
VCCRDEKRAVSHSGSAQLAPKLLAFKVGATFFGTFSARFPQMQRRPRRGIAVANHSTVSLHHEFPVKAVPMKARKILVPTDFSEYSQAALEMATSLARGRGAEITVLHVQQLPVALGGGELYHLADPDDREIKQLLTAVVPTDPSVPCQHRLVLGDPGSSILQVAEEEGVDLIVMPTHGRTGLSRLLMGSVAEQVVRKAKCPVLTVKVPAQAADEPRAETEERSHA